MLGVKRSLLAWESYPAATLYVTMCAIALQLGIFHHAWILERVQDSQVCQRTAAAHPDLPGLQAFCSSAATLVLLLPVTAASCILPCALAFLGITYLHSRS
jgi:hypothetical protein